MALKHIHPVTFLTATYHWPRVIGEGPVKCLDVFEFKHVPLDKSFPDLLISPCDEELVVMIGLLSQPRGEVNWGLQIHSFPLEKERSQPASCGCLSWILANTIRSSPPCGQESV